MFQFIKTYNYISYIHHIFCLFRKLFPTSGHLKGFPFQFLGIALLQLCNSRHTYGKMED